MTDTDGAWTPHARRSGPNTRLPSSRAWRSGGCALLALCAWSCLYDPDDRCSPGQELKDGLCVCDEGLVLKDGLCVEEPEPEPVPTGLGESCDADTPCAGEPFSHCQDASGGGYCTRECSSHDDCGGDYYCPAAGTPRVCLRAPTGQATPCETSEDCAEFDASYCLVSPRGSACLVPDCLESGCSRGFICRDLAAIFPGTPPVCTPEMP